MFKYLKFLILTLILSIGLVSCSSKSSDIEINQKINRVDLLKFMSITNDLRVAENRINDNYYSIPPEEWVSKSFIDKYSIFLKDFKTKYEDQSVDCDKYSKLCESFAQFNTKRLKNTGLGFGEFYYTRDDMQKHAINMIICSKNNKLELLFFEPQTGEIIRLSELERKSCEFWIF